jgi:membrane fusion protein (multidrug efflux system)
MTHPVFSVPGRQAIAPVFALALFLAGCGPQETPHAAGPMPVTVVTLQPQKVTLQRELPGRTSPKLVAEVRPRVDGIVLKRLFEEGSLVKAGQPLYQLDDAMLRASLASAEAALARAEATLNTARLQSQRINELAPQGLVSKSDQDNSTAALQQAQADVLAAKAGVQAARIQVDYARITAPISGRIGKSAVTQGALVTANQPAPLATIQQLDPIYVDLTQSSSELLALRKALDAGTLKRTDRVPVTILLEDGSEYRHKGQLEFADITVDPGTGSFLQRVQVPNPENTLLPGVYLRALVSSGERSDALLVPQQGIARDPKGNAQAMVANADNVVEVRAVQVSRTLGDQWLVEGGLAAGDRVIVEGLQKIHPGATVAPVEKGSDAAPATGTAATPAP